MHALLAVLLATPAVARSEPISIHVGHESSDETPLLSLDPIVMSRLEGLSGRDDHQVTTIDIGKTKLVLESIATDNVDAPGETAIDVPFRASRIGARIARKLGPLELEINAATGTEQMRFGNGNYYDVGMALTFRRQLSRWMHAWISLGISQRTWIGEPPPGEAKQDTRFMLTVGTTFR